MQNQVHLLKTRRFLPLFATQFLGAFNDNMLKNAMVILIVYSVMDTMGLPRGAMAPLAGGIFILPFFLFSATAGQLADKVEKTVIIRLVKLFEILLMALAAWGFHRQDLAILLAALFGMGVHSSFFGPIKYSILPVHLQRDELISGNALVEAATFVAILLGTILGGAMIAMEGGRTAASAMMLVVAVAGYGASLFIPKAPPPAPGLTVEWNIFRTTRQVVRSATSIQAVYLSILGISWFWLLGAVYLSLFPVYVKNVLEGSEGVVTLFLALFSVGIGAGSLLCNKLLKGEINTSYVPLGAFGMTLFTLDLCLATAGYPSDAGHAWLADFIQRPAAWRICLDLFMVAVCGGLYIVPLYAIMQTRCREEERARVIAANNIINALFMVVSAGLTALALAKGQGPVRVFFALAALNGVAYFYIRSLAAESGERPVLRLIFTVILKALYRVRVRGAERLRAAGGNVMVVANHQSLMDGVLLAVFLPGRYSFVVDRQMARLWWARPFLGLVDVHTLDSENPIAIRDLVKLLKGGGRLVIFPEGRITVTGALMKIQGGPALIAKRSGCKIVPVHIDGAIATWFSRMTDKLSPRLFPRISITVLEPRGLDLPDGLEGPAARRAAAAGMESLMRDMMFTAMDRKRTFPEAALDIGPVLGGDRWAVTGPGGVEEALTHGKLVNRAGRIATALAAKAPGERFVGLAAPNCEEAAAAFLGIQIAGGAVAALDPEWDTRTLKEAVTAAGLKTALAAQGPASEELARLGVKVYLIEEMGKTYAGAGIGMGTNQDPEAPAAAVYIPARGRWAVYSHSALLANCYQLAAALDIGPADIIFSAPPMAAHAGLLLGTALPLAMGIRTYQGGGPSLPAAREAKATVVFGEAGFLAAMAASATEGKDNLIRRTLLVENAPPPESLEEEWSRRFGHRFCRLTGWAGEGMIAGSRPENGESGPEAFPLPGALARLEPPAGPGEWGRLVVNSPGMATGFMDAANPGRVIPEPPGWRDTGRMARMDAQGRLTIQPGGAAA